VDLNAYAQSENQLPPPSELGLTAHWLAVDGVPPHIVQNPISRTRSSTTVHHVQQDDDDDDEDAASHDRPVSIRQLLPRLLSEELQLYFSRVTIAVESGGATPATRLQQDASLKSVARDRGLQELVPFLCRYIASQIFQHIGDVEHCRTLIRLTRSLLMNPYLHLELQVCSKYDKS
jgi:transcription initiation factor TFIID subunit 6